MPHMCPDIQRHCRQTEKSAGRKRKCSGRVGLRILLSMEQLPSAITLIKQLIIKYSVILEGEFASRTGENHWRSIISPDEHLAADFLYPA